MTSLSTQLERVSGELNSTNACLSEIKQQHSTLMLQNSEILRQFQAFQQMQAELKQQHEAQIQSLQSSQSSRSTPLQSTSLPQFHQNQVEDLLQVPKLAEFKLRLYGLKVDKPHPYDDIFASINFQTTEIEDFKDFAKDPGATVYTNQGQAYQFKYDPDAPPAQAVLMKNQLPAVNDAYGQLKIALTVMNMMENVLSKGDKLHITTKDPFIAKIAELYLQTIKSLTVDETKIFENIDSSVSVVNVDEDTEKNAQAVFASIMASQAYQELMKNPATVSWVQDFPSSLKLIINPNSLRI